VVTKDDGKANNSQMPQREADDVVNHPSSTHVKKKDRKVDKSQTLEAKLVT